MSGTRCNWGPQVPLRLSHCISVGISTSCLRISSTMTLPSSTWSNEQQYRRLRPNLVRKIRPNWHRSDPPWTWQHKAWRRLKRWGVRNRDIQPSQCIPDSFYVTCSEVRSPGYGMCWTCPHYGHASNFWSPTQRSWHRPGNDWTRCGTLQVAYDVQRSHRQPNWKPTTASTCGRTQRSTSSYSTSS
jgi:hypothetical protein